MSEPWADLCAILLVSPTCPSLLSLFPFTRSLSCSVKLSERTTEPSKNKVCFFFPFSQLSLCVPADVTRMYIVKHCLSDVATLYHCEMFLLLVSRNTLCPEVCSDAHIMTLALVYHCLHGTIPPCCSELTCDVGFKACHVGSMWLYFALSLCLMTGMFSPLMFNASIGMI